jgi:purine-binding chemotaxis protein CheW
VSVSVAAQDSRWDVLAQAAARSREADEAGLELSWLLCFELAGTPYALPVERVRGIVRVPPVTPMPRVPQEVLGVISLRGEIVQVVDLRRRLGLAEAPSSRASRVVIVHGGDGRAAGLLVDRVSEVLSVGEDALRPPSTEAAAVESLCVQGERFVSVLDLDRVLVFDAE